jgi:hypothetical protein
LLIEEYGAELEYKKGYLSVIADALSRVPTEEVFTFKQPIDDNFPLNLDNIAALQAEDQDLTAALAQPKPKYKEIMINERKLFVHNGSEAICVPTCSNAGHHATLVP